MLDYNPFQIGIIACPGGQSFAGQIAAYLRILTIKRYKKKIESLSEQFPMDRKDIKREISKIKSIVTVNSVSNHLTIPEYEVETNFLQFANGEFKTEILSSIRGRDIYIIQDVENHYPLAMHKCKEKKILSVNDHIFCMLVTVDAALQAGAKRVTLILPTYPYSRQHKKQKREGLTAARFGQIVEHIGVARIITLDIHSREIENCFNKLRLENLHASYQVIKVLKDAIDIKSPDLVIVSPDTGAVDRNKFYAESLNKPLGMLYKERDYSRISHDANSSNITHMRLLGDVKNKVVFMCDDMIGTGGTLLKAMKFLKEMGAVKLICAVSLPLFTEPAVEMFDAAYKEGLFYRIIGTNAVYHSDELLTKEWYDYADVSKLFANTIYRLHTNQNLSQLLDNRNIINNLLNEENPQ